MRKGNILIIDDSVLVRNYLSKMVNSISHLELCGVASNGKSGIQQILLHLPDVIILDLEMENGDGVFVLEQIKQSLKPSEYPFVIIHSSRARHGDPLFQKAIEFGFCDFVLKVQSDPENFFNALNNAFLPKINQGLEAKQSRSLLTTTRSSDIAEIHIPSFVPSKEAVPPIPAGLRNLDSVLKKKPTRPSIIIIGASTGGPQAIRTLLSDLPKNISVPIVIIQHMPETFTESFAKELERASGLPTQEVQHSTPLNPGHIYVFPGGIHGRLNLFGHIYVYYSDTQNYDAHPFKPSINLAIQNLMGSFHDKAIYFILSGMGKDGALGAAQLYSTGSLVIAQDQESSVVWGMPKAAIQENAVDVILNQNEFNEGLKLILKTYGI